MSRKHGWINIEGLVSVQDVFYRYQMPPLQGHAEKNWTVLPSFAKTTDALHRQQEEVLKYLGISLNTQTRFDQGRACIKGHFSDQELHQQLRHYIQEFVLCAKCKKPETAYRIRNSGKIVQKCFACGHKTPLDMDHKLCGFIKAQYRAAKANLVTTTPHKKDSTRNNRDDMVHALESQAVGKTAKKTKSKSEKVKDTEAPKNSTSSSMSDEAALNEAVETIRCMLVHETEKPNITASQLARAVTREQRAFVLMPRDKIRMLILAAAAASKPTTDVSNKTSSVAQRNTFDPIVYEALGQIIRQSEMMRRFMEEYAITCFEEVVATQYKSGVQFVKHIKVAYDEDSISEEAILAWWNGHLQYDSGLVDPVVRQRLRKVAIPFIEWLINAEDEDDDDDSN